MTQLKLQAKARLLANWWSDLSKEQQQQYIKDHPKSAMAIDDRAKKSGLSEVDNGGSAYYDKPTAPKAPVKQWAPLKPSTNSQKKAAIERSIADYGRRIAKARKSIEKDQAHVDKAKKRPDYDRELDGYEDAIEESKKEIAGYEEEVAKLKKKLEKA